MRRRNRKSALTYRGWVAAGRTKGYFRRLTHTQVRPTDEAIAAQYVAKGARHAYQAARWAAPRLKRGAKLYGQDARRAVGATKRRLSMWGEKWRGYRARRKTSRTGAYLIR